jgi:hypothetical protein
VKKPPKSQKWEKVSSLAKTCHFFFDVGCQKFAGSLIKGISHKAAFRLFSREIFGSHGKWKLILKIWTS